MKRTLENLSSQVLSIATIVYILNVHDIASNKQKMQKVEYILVFVI